jgi:hypothetical protein
LELVSLIFIFDKMKWFFRFFKSVFLVLFVLFLLRSWLFKMTVQYVPASEQSLFELTDEALLQSLESPASGISLEVILRQALDLTTRRLRFRGGHNPIDPNRLFHKRKAHCVGYAAYFATVFNQLAQRAGMGSRYRAHHLRGHILFLGLDLHQFSHDPFFKDHDFNSVEDRASGKRFFIDASVKDALGITFVKGEN